MDWDESDLVEVDIMMENVDRSYLSHVYRKIRQTRMQSHTSISKLRSDLSTMEYLAANEAIFTQLMMSKKEQFTRGNRAIYKKTFA